MDRLSRTVGISDGGITVKEYLKRLGLSSTLIKRVKCGGILLNGAAVTVRARLSVGDLVEIVMPTEPSENIEPIAIEVETVYEDEYILAVNKPKNMPTHPSRGNSLPTLANAVMWRCGSDFTFRAVNRLDRDTSGIVLIAKDALSAAKLSESMKRGEFQKKYIAIISGIPKERRGVIDAPIERESDGSIKRTVREDGKRAVTEYEIIGEDDFGNGICKLTLHTGRTHQIRVHMAYIGHPLVGDFLYGERGDESYFLHCFEIGFPHPASGEFITLTSEPSFKKLLE